MEWLTAVREWSRSSAEEHSGEPGRSAASGGDDARQRRGAERRGAERRGAEGSGGERSKEKASETIQRGLRQEVVRDRDRRLRREVPLGDILPHPYLGPIPAYREVPLKGAVRTSTRPRGASLHSAHSTARV